MWSLVLPRFTYQHAKNVHAANNTRAPAKAPISITNIFILPLIGKQDDFPDVVFGVGVAGATWTDVLCDVVCVEEPEDGRDQLKPLKSACQMESTVYYLLHNNVFS